MRNLSQNELVDWYSLRRPEQKFEFLQNLKIVKLDKENRFVKQNSIPRNIDEMPNFQRHLIHKRDGCCAYCGDTNVKLTVDHFIPASAWPDNLIWLANTSSNLVSACWDCNKSKSTFYSESAYKQIYAYSPKCGDCSYDSCSCQRIVAWCGKCQNTATVAVCNLPKIVCEDN